MQKNKKISMISSWENDKKCRISTLYFPQSYKSRFPQDSGSHFISSCTVLSIHKKTEKKKEQFLSQNTKYNTMYNTKA